MIELDRRKDHKWIMQKNVSSKDIITAYLKVISESKTAIDYSDVKNQLRRNSIYKGRSNSGSLSTMGVRFSQMCFYMFGYKTRRCFYPSPMTLNLLKQDKTISDESNFLVNLFSIQYPHPFSETSSEFQIYAGRLFIKLLLEDRINQKLYIDEIIWFLPFIETIDDKKYEELINSILEYRQLSFIDKLLLFDSIKNKDDVFANVTHEFNYYFLRMFRDFGVVDIIPDEEHNDGHLFKFHHGTGDTKRTDAYDSGKKCSGYVKISDKVFDDAKKLNDNFSAFDTPTTMNSEGIYTLEDWKNNIYNTEPLEYLSCITKENLRDKDIYDTIQEMLHASKYGSHDGKDFENALTSFMYLFREIREVDQISGAGNTDLLCIIEDKKGNIHRINIDAKTRKAGLEEINARRLESHLTKHGSEFCIVVAPRFASGVNYDISGHKIVTVKAEDLGSYCYKECITNQDGYADFDSIMELIKNSLGSDITEQLRDLTVQRYGIAI